MARDGLVEHRLARRGNALVLLDRGMSCSQVGAVLLLDDDTVRTWFRLYREDGIEGLAGFGYEGSSCHLSPEQRERLRSWVTEVLERLGGKLRAARARSVTVGQLRGVLNAHGIEVSERGLRA